MRISDWSSDVCSSDLMSSSILSRRIDVSRYGMIYAGAQKNIGPSGLAVAIIHPALLARGGQPRAPILDIGNHRKHDSMLNTPPTFAWYLAGPVLHPLQQPGAWASTAATNTPKA